MLSWVATLASSFVILSPTLRRTSFLSSSLEIQVFDNVFDKKTCHELLHPLAIDHADRCVSSVTQRESGNIHTPLEVALDHLLTTLGDTCPIIEYWSRQEYMNIDAHCDIDERQLEREGTLRHPSYSHVLYLKINTKGPTCIFNQVGGWKNCDDETTTLITVPAVEGRLLRFPGNLLHAVPKPHDRWLMSEEENGAWKLKERLEEYDDECDEDGEVKRSVLLFNTWDDEGPMDVLPDSFASIPDGIEIEGTDLQSFLDEEQAMRVSQWQDDYGGIAFEDILCNPLGNWVAHDLPDLPENDDYSRSHVRMCLMGKQNRRLNANHQVSMHGSGIRVALEQENLVSQIQLQTNTFNSG